MPTSDPDSPTASRFGFTTHYHHDCGWCASVRPENTEGRARLEARGYREDGVDEGEEPPERLQDEW